MTQLFISSLDLSLCFRVIVRVITLSGRSYWHGKLNSSNWTHCFPLRNCSFSSPHSMVRPINPSGRSGSPSQFSFSPSLPYLRVTPSYQHICSFDHLRTSWICPCLLLLQYLIRFRIFFFWPVVVITSLVPPPPSLLAKFHPLPLRLESST